MKSSMTKFTQKLSDIWWYIKYYLSCIKWEILHRFHPHHRYHIIKTGLKPGYYDIDMRIIYGLFNLLCEFYEIEAPTTDWEGSGPDHKVAYDTMKEIYEYWKERRPLIEEDLLNADIEEVYDKSEALGKMDQQYLHKIIDIMYYLWS